MTASSIAAELAKLEHSAVLELYELDATALGAGQYFFHAGTNALRAAVVWQGQAYSPFPVYAEGFEATHDGPLPRPRLRVANVDGIIGVLNRDYRNLQGARLVRRRVLAKFLDAVNFAGGVNATADPDAGYPDDVWRVDRKSHQDNEFVEYELGSPMDVAEVKLPRRQIIARICGWAYRSTECGYTGGPVAKDDDTATADPTLDKCGHRLTSCRLRFANNDLPFGSFPGAGQVREL
jgi:lambda family phage minor tail protein L